MSKRTVKKKYPFSLKLSSTFSELHSKYNINLTFNTTTIREDVPETVSFHDELRRLHKCCISTIVTGKKYNCYWCRHPFEGQPIGCPIDYKPQVISRIYNSEISKDSFSVTESIPRAQAVASDTVKKIVSNESYETDGVFCSFNCALAFANENKTNPLYTHSISLINRIYNDVSKKGAATLTPAPSWRLLEEYGGPLTIDEYRKNLHRISYDEYGFQRPIFRPVSSIYEEKYKL